MSAAYEQVLDALTRRGSRSTNVRETRSMWTCPTHDDHNPSLEAIDKGDKVILACYAGCHTDDIIATLGLTWPDLFEGDLTPDKLHDRYGQLVRSYLYRRSNGDPWYYVDRYFPKTFRQRLPDVAPVRDLSDREAVKRLGIREGGQPRQPILYHAPEVRRAVLKGDATVWFLDGEKDVETAERHGLVATCPPGFAKWHPDYAHFLRGAKQVVLVVDQDMEKPDGTLGVGQQNATVARAGFRAMGIKVRIVSPAVGKDLTDHFTAGYDVGDFVVDTSVAVRPRGITGAALMDREFAPVTWAVDGLLTDGLTICAGDPKIGKSWVSLDIATAVASGGFALGTLQCQQGNVLYLAREDTYRRLQSRLSLVMGGDLSAVPQALELVPGEVDWVGGEEGIAHLTEWAEEVRSPRLVVIDTIAKVEPEMGEDGKRGIYSANYSMMGRYKQWADDHQVAVVMVHHTRKGPANQKQGMENDPFSKISGTRGLTGAADTLWVLEAVRGSGEGFLHVTGRDVEERPIPLRKSGPLWVAEA